MDFKEHDAVELVKKTRLLKQLDHMNETVIFIGQMLKAIAEKLEMDESMLAHYAGEKRDIM